MDSRTPEQKKKQTDEAIAAFERGRAASLNEDEEPSFHIVNRDD